MSSEQTPLDKFFDLNATKTVYWDLETTSCLNVTQCGAYNYATDPSTDVHFMCFAIDGGEVQIWKRGDPPPAPFVNPTGYKFVSDNWEFERLILEHVLVSRYGFVSIPLAQHDCAQRRALANAFPPELGLRCIALGLPYRKDPDARKAMLRLSRPQPAKKRKKPKPEDLATSICCSSAARPTSGARAPATTIRAFIRRCRKNSTCSCTTQRSTRAASMSTCRS